MPTTLPTDAQAQLEHDLAQYIQHLKQIDRVLEAPVHSLIHLARPRNWKPGERLGAPPVFPVWITQNPEQQSSSDDNSFAQGLCACTVQRLSRIRRRFKWLDPEDDALLATPGVRSWLARAFIPAHYDAARDPEGKEYFEQIFLKFQSTTFGTLNPLTAAQIFRTLVEAGEDHAHEGVGFLAFFAMIWPLYRSRPDPLLLGARIEPSTPTAYVTAKCLLPVETLKGICSRRADALRLLRRHLGELDELAQSYDPDAFSATSVARKFNATLDSLRGQLLRLSEIAIAGGAFGRAAEAVGLISDRFTRDQLVKTYADVQTILQGVIREVGAKTREVLDEAEVVIAGIEREIVGGLASEEGLNALIAHRGMRFQREQLSNKEYRDDLTHAAGQALGICRSAITALSDATTACETPAETPFKSLQNALQALEKANRTIREEMGGLMVRPGDWCRGIADREVAYAAALNMSEFDPAELTSSLLVAVRLRVYSRRQVTEAVGKAVQGAQPDGSWRLGHPYYSPDNEFGLRPPSADIVWTLTRCIEEHPEADNADEALIRFVDWLERTRRYVGSRGRRDYGWRGDRMRYDDKLHVVTTAYAVNALLEIRDLLEYRIWQLCEKRFTVIPTHRGLDRIAPVDLGVAHHRRLHRILSHVSRSTSAPDEVDEQSADGTAPRRKKARPAPPLYSLVLHGPPGSSKTVLIEGMARNMWGSGGWGRRTAPLIRITPADFTRRGESRIDSEARLIFDLLSHLRRVTILFDEIDDLLAQRVRGEGEQVSFIGLVVPAMLNRLQDLRDACPHQEICFVLGTNYIDNIEPALVRRGRIDRALPVVYPDADSRHAIVADEFRKWLRNEAPATLGVERLAPWIAGWCELLVRGSAGWNYNDIVQVCREAVMAVQNTVDDLAELSEDDSGIPLPQPEASPEGAEQREAAGRLRHLGDEIASLIDSARATITRPDYTRRLCLHGGRTELRGEYIQYRICAQEWDANGEALVQAEVTTWSALDHPSAPQRAHVPHTTAFQSELAAALSAVGKYQSDASPQTRAAPPPF